MSAEAAPMSEKQAAFAALQRMPESATLDEMIEELTILAALRRGEAAADAGQVVSHEDVVRRSAAWTSE